VGFSGVDDKRLRVILFTVHSITFGKEVYPGIPVDSKLYEMINKGDIP
jgi:hypothetical protein